MTPELWAEVDRVLTAALALDRGERAAYLAGTCADQPGLRSEVESLLASHELAADFIETDTWMNQSVQEKDPPPSRIGTRVGPYKLVEQIGRGGMGTVYIADRDDGQFHKRVAIKLISSPMPASEMLQRFRSERQILAHLEHPNIARLLDGGLTEDGSPYIVMEYVEGVPIHEYGKARSLSIRERLELFRTVCSAVHFAHQNLVVHRDIKPANILVTSEGVPKLLDFGIAKILSSPASSSPDPATAPLLKAMTPDYASPEQVQGQPITTASDIYSLGVLLYELLAGTKPYTVAGRTLDDIVRCICVEEPPKPSSVNSALSADLDAIILKALRKEPGERYASAKEFSEDLSRYSDGMPVLARHGSFRYFARKYIQRHKPRVAALITAIVLLFAGIGAVAWEAHVANLERAKAQRRFEDVRKLAGSIVFEINDGLTGLPGSTEARRLLVAKGLEYLNALEKESAGDPRLQIEIGAAYLRMGDIQGNVAVANLGDSRAAQESYRKSAEILRSALAGNPMDSAANLSLVEALGNLSNSYSVMGDSANSLKTAREAVATAESLASRDPSNEPGRRSLANSYFSLAMALNSDERAIPVWQQSLETFESLLQVHPDGDREQRNVALVHKYLAEIFRRRSQFDLAIEHARRAEELDSKRVAAKPSDTTAQLDLALDFGSTADTYKKLGDLDHALDRYVQSLAIRQKLAARDPKDARLRGRLLYADLMVGWTLLKNGKASASLEYFNPASAIGEDLIAKDPAQIEARRNLSYVRAGIGEAQDDLGQKSNACASFGEALSIHADVDRRGASTESEQRDIREWTARAAKCK